MYRAADYWCGLVRGSDCVTLSSFDAWLIAAATLGLCFLGLLATATVLATVREN
jgi:hypothetical protein